VYVHWQKEAVAMSDTSLQAKIGYRVRRRRMALGWNQTELASRMHMPQGHISRLERGKYAAVNPEKLRTLAQILSTTTDYLLGLSDDPGAIEPVQGGGEDTPQEARDDTPAPPRHRPRSKRPKTQAQE
jgi:transcriptional regulator with XRE-family HTH domain